MGNFKVKVNNAAESREAQELFFELGYRWIDIGATYYKTSPNFNYLTAYFKGKTLAQGHGFDAEKELTLPELRAMVNPSLNDQYAEIEQVRQASKDNVNNPQHYNKGGVECIDAIEASMTPEAFKGYLKGNVQKYMWRYEQKGGVESLRKAQWYLERLIASMDS